MDKFTSVLSEMQEHLGSLKSLWSMDALDKAFVKYEAQLEDGTVVSKSEGWSLPLVMDLHVLPLQPCYFCPALSKAVKTMKKREKISVFKQFPCWHTHSASMNAIGVLQCFLLLSIVLFGYDYALATVIACRVLELEGTNVKALYRRAQAYIQLADLVLAEIDIKKALYQVDSKVILDNGFIIYDTTRDTHLCIITEWFRPSP
ncbi:hypothetical protein IFM89_034884 [Coptis chinensis]|uniref:Uncharacterized protein n=1 Tax=Coptis chinensis TaxID=261450 RepID=A0A835I5L9_9MAGN|nr:hypothetical protein IFM89_034884 [Coptis chinensis]